MNYKFDKKKKNITFRGIEEYLNKPFTLFMLANILYFNKPLSNVNL